MHDDIIANPQALKLYIQCFLCSPVHFCSLHYSVLFSLTQSGPWWRRELQHEYLFPLTQDHSGLEDFLKKNNFNNVVSNRLFCNTHLAEVFTFSWQTNLKYRTRHHTMPQNRVTCEHVHSISTQVCQVYACRYTLNVP